MNEYSRVNWQDGTVLQNAKVTIDGVDYDVQPAVESGTTPLNATNLNKMDAGIKNASEDIITLNENKISHTVIELIAVSDTAPVECETGDKYYDTTEQYIYTATGHNTWGSQGVLPVSTYLYADITENKMYYYDGTEFKSYGGGGETVPAEIFVGDVLPEDADGIKLWLTDDDALDGEGNYISNEYGTSQEIGYSQEYLNGDVLYENASGTSSNIELNGDIANYRYIELTTINKDATSETYQVYKFDTSKTQYNISGLSIGTSSYNLFTKSYTKGTTTGGKTTLTANGGRLYSSSSGNYSNYEVFQVIKIVGYK